MNRKHNITALWTPREVSAAELKKKKENCDSFLRNLNRQLCSLSATLYIAVTFSWHIYTWKQASKNHTEKPHWGSWKSGKHTLGTHTLLAGHSRRWSWPPQSRTRGGKHTPFLAQDLQHDGWLRPLEKRRQEIQSVGLLVWIPCSLTTYRELKCCLKSSRHI